jgi:hypothetical protein
MRRLVTIVILCAGCVLTAGAQSFTQRLQQKTQAGQGTVTVSHDKAIDDLVNGQAASQQDHESQEKQDKPESPAQKKPETPPKDERHDTTTDSVTVDSRRKVLRGGVKINGYRVQAFAGGNQRKDRKKAEQVGNTIKAHYPDTPIYVHFYSPRWICRVGNFRTYEEAHEMLRNIRNLGISGASIVKGKIIVPSY